MSIQQKWHIVWKSTYNHNSFIKCFCFPFATQLSPVTITGNIGLLIGNFSVLDKHSWCKWKPCYSSMRVELSWRSSKKVLISSYFAKCWSHFGSEDSWISSCLLSCFWPTSMQGMVHGLPITWRKDSFTLRTDAQWFALRYWVRRLKTILHRVKSLRQGRENKKGHQGCSSGNFKKILRQGSFKKNWWSIFYKKMKFTFPGRWPWTLASNSSEKNRDAEASQVVGMVSDRCEMYCHEKQCQNKVRSSPWSLLHQARPSPEI